LDRPPISTVPDGCRTPYLADGGVGGLAVDVLFQLGLIVAQYLSNILLWNTLCPALSFVGGCLLEDCVCKGLDVKKCSLIKVHTVLIFILLVAGIHRNPAVTDAVLCPTAG